MRVTIFACAALVAAATSPALAQEVVDPDRDTVSIGIGVGYVPSYEGSDNYNIVPVGVLRGKVSGINFFTRGTQFFVDVIPDGADANALNFELGPVAAARLNRSSRIKDAQVAALGDLDIAIEVGGFVGLSKTGVITSDFDNLAFRVSYLRDVTNTHDSYVITPSIEYATPLSETALVGLSVSADIVGDRYAQTYYGVTPAGAAASGLPAFTAEGGIKNITFGLLGGLSLSGDLRRGWALFAIGSYSRLLGDFKRSPVVSIAGDADQFLGAIGIGYTF